MSQSGSGFQETIDRLSITGALLLFWASTVAFMVLLPYMDEVTMRGRLFSACIGLAGFSLLHAVRKTFSNEIMPVRYSQVAFHFSWIGGASGILGFFSPALGMQTAMLGLIVAVVALLMFPVKASFVQRNAYGALLFIAVVLFVSDFGWQFFSGTNQWKTRFWRYPVDSVLFAMSFWLSARAIAGAKPSQDA